MTPASPLRRAALPRAAPRCCAAARRWPPVAWSPPSFAAATAATRWWRSAAPTRPRRGARILDQTGPWDPWLVTLGKTTFAAQGRATVAVDATTGAKLLTFRLPSRYRAVWQGRLVFLVNARDSRSDSDYGDAAVYAIDARRRAVVLEDDIGADVPGGQRASDPVFDGDMAYAIAGGRVHAYRIAASP